MSQILLAFPSKHCHLRKYVLYGQLGHMEYLSWCNYNDRTCYGDINVCRFDWRFYANNRMFSASSKWKMVSFLINAGHLIQSGLRLWTNGSLLMMITIIIKVTDQVTWSGVLGTGHTVLDKEHLFQVHIVAI